MNTIHFNPVEFAGAGEDELLHQIEEHKYLANQTIPFEISMEEAYESWSLLVHEPLARAIEAEGLDKAFPEVAKGELYLWGQPPLVLHEEERHGRSDRPRSGPRLRHPVRRPRPDPFRLLPQARRRLRAPMRPLNVR